MKLYLNFNLLIRTHSLLNKLPSNRSGWQSRFLPTVHRCPHQNGANCCTIWLVSQQWYGCPRCWYWVYRNMPHLSQLLAGTWAVWPIFHNVSHRGQTRGWFSGSETLDDHDLGANCTSVVHFSQKTSFAFKTFCCTPQMRHFAFVISLLILTYTRSVYNSIWRKNGSWCPSSPIITQSLDALWSNQMCVFHSPT